MKERPILFSAPMVRAILAGTKTQTRRLAKFDAIDGANLGFSGLEAGQYCTGDLTSGAVLYGRGRGGVWEQRTKPLPYLALPGDRLWVRETWGLRAYGDFTDWNRDSIRGRESDDVRGQWELDYCADWGEPMEACFWRPSIHMPRWASRITLEVTGVRVERLQTITQADARAEGVVDTTGAWELDGTLRDTDRAGPRGAFEALWESINGAESWAANPWVWVVEFRRHSADEKGTGASAHHADGET